MSFVFTEEDRAHFRALEDADRANGITLLPTPRNDAEDSSWTPVDLAAIVAGVTAGEIVGPVPELMRRSDEVPLLYPGEVHSLAGEPESAKGWMSLKAVVDELTAGRAVLYLDFEDAPASIVTRLLALGVAPDAIIERFSYIHPVEPLTPGAISGLLSRNCSLVVIDGLSEAYALLGLDPYSNPDAASFLAILPRPLAAAGAAVLQIDHVVKAKDTRGRWALGAGHKLAGISTAFSTEVVKPPSRTTAGLVKLKIEKDRHGHLRGHASSGVIAMVTVTPEDDGEHVTVALDPPEVSVTETGQFRPTNLMEKVSRYLEAEPGAGVKAVRRGVSGKNEFVDQALQVLIAEGFVRPAQDGQARRHYVKREYREETDRAPVPRPCPDRAPTVPRARVAPTVPPCPPL